MNVINDSQRDTLYAIQANMPMDNANIRIGRLGCFTFHKGYYVYVGSAKRNLQARLERHVKIEKKFHWHFDYLRPYVEIIDIKTSKHILVRKVNVNFSNG